MAATLSVSGQQVNAAAELLVSGFKFHGSGFEDGGEDADCAGYGVRRCAGHGGKFQVSGFKWFPKPSSLTPHPSNEMDFLDNMRYRGIDYHS